MSRNHLDVLVKQLEGLDHDNPNNEDLTDSIHKKIEKLRSKTSAIDTLVTNKQPCYFNAGCCSFSDGEITGIEIKNGAIGLVKWNKEERNLIESENLEEIYKSL